MHSQVWPVIHSRLTKRGLKSISGEEALRLQKRGATILDVYVLLLPCLPCSVKTITHKHARRRPAYQYEKERIAGAASVPMFRPVAGSDNWSRLKKVVMGSLAMAATGDNSLFFSTRKPCWKLSW
jgi:hypothetical protein